MCHRFFLFCEHDDLFKCNSIFKFWMEIWRRLGYEQRPYAIFSVIDCGKCIRQNVFGELNLESDDFFFLLQIDAYQISAGNKKLKIYTTWMWWTFNWHSSLYIQFFMLLHTQTLVDSSSRFVGRLPVSHDHYERLEWLCKILALTKCGQ